jgi:hypothetical protein
MSDGEMAEYGGALFRALLPVCNVLASVGEGVSIGLPH